MAQPVGPKIIPLSSAGVEARVHPAGTLPTQRRKFSREFKLEAVNLVRERGVTVAQAARDLDVHENVLRKWVQELSKDPKHTFPSHGQMKPVQQEIVRQRKEVAKLKAERDIPKKAAAYFAREVSL